MASSQTQLDIIIKAQDSASKELKKISDELSKMNKAGTELGKNSKSNFFEPFNKMAAGATVAVAAIGALGGVILKMTGDLEQTKVGFSTLLGSVEKANKFIGELRDLAASTPFEFKEITGLATRFLAVGYSAEEAKAKLIAVGNAASAMGTGAEGANRITLALTQMASRGKVAGGEMLQLSEVGINGFKLLAEQTGKTELELREMAEKGLLNGKVAADLMTKAFNQKWGDAMEKQSKTLLGLLSTLKDEITILATTIGEEFIDSVKEFVVQAIKVAQSIGNWVKEHKELVKIVTMTIALFATFVTGLLGAIVVIGKIQGAMILLSQAMGVATAGATGLKVALASVPLLLAITVALVGFELVMNQISKLKQEMLAVEDSRQAQADTTMKMAQEARAGLQSENALVKERAKLINDKAAILSSGNGMERVSGINQRIAELAKQIQADKEATAALEKAKAGGAAAKASYDSGGKATAVAGLTAEQEAKNLQNLLAGVSGSGDKAGKKLSDRIKDLKDKLAEMAKDGARSLLELRVAHEDSMGESEKKMQELADEYQKTADEGAKALAELAAQNKEALQSIDDSISDTQQKLADLNRDFEKGRIGDVQDLAEAFVEAQQRIDEIKQQIRSSTDAGEIQKLKEEQRVQEAALARTASVAEQYSAEIAEAKRRASLSDLERAIEDFNKKRELAQQEYNEKAAAIQKEMSDLQRKRDLEVQHQAEKMFEMQSELKAKLDKITKEQFAVGLQQAEEQKIYDESTKFINDVLANANAVRQSLTIKTKQVTLDAVQAEIDKYRELAQAIQQAQSAKSLSLIPTYSVYGSRATGGNIPVTGPYLMHEGEYVVPKNGALVGGGSSGGGIVVNINGGNYLSEDAAEMLGDKLIDKLQQNFRF